MAWHDKFAEITKMTHTEQAHWWLNGFWDEGAKDYAEEVWTTTHDFLEIQLGRPVLYGGRMVPYEEGCDLDEFQSHRILEKMGSVMTVVELRKKLKELDLDSNKRMCMTEYLLEKYGKKPEDVVNAPQGTVDPKALEEAEKACNDASEALDKASSDKEACDAAAKEAAEKKKDAEDALAAAEAAEAEVKKAEAELQAALDEIEAIEKEKADKIAKHQAVIDDPNSSGVKKGRAVQEKEAILAEDPLPLRKAKITQGAALKKVTKARQLAESETAKSNAAADAAAAAKEQADAAKIQADEAAVAAQAAFEEAMKSLETLKSAGGTAPQGKIWWMDRVLQEKKKFMR